MRRLSGQPVAQLRVRGEQTSAQRGTGSAATGTTGGTQGEQALIQWANKTLPVVQQHLERARSIVAALK